MLRSVVLRSCGDCTACCEGWLSAKDLKMWAGKACEHKTAAGCGIYANRPENPCKAFQCGWLDGTLPEDEKLKPNHCGAIVLTDRKEAGWSVWRVVPVGRSVPPATLERITALAAETQQPFVWFERVENFAEEPWKTSTFAAGPEAFLTDMKWDFSDEDVWDLK